MALAAGVALLQSYVRRAAGVRGQREVRAERAARVAAMTGDVDADATDDPDAAAGVRSAPRPARAGRRAWSRCSAPRRSSAATTRSAWSRLLVGAFFLGAVTDAMLLGHWYLVQPGLGRDPIKELVKAVAALWPFEVDRVPHPRRAWCRCSTAPIDDGYGGIMGWMWVVARRSPRSGS